MMASQAMAAFSEKFVHQRVIGSLRGLATGGIIGGVAGFVAPGGPGSTTTTAIAGATPRIPGSRLTGCPAGFERTATGQCARTGVRGFLERGFTGGETGFAPGDEFGAAVMGAFGAALEPAQLPATRLRCPRGTVLGRDNLCYNRRDLRKSERKWPPGTKPILTGGQVSTLKKAQRIHDRLKRLGLAPGHAKPRKKAKPLLHTHHT